jgi:hypothetical protein
MIKISMEVGQKIYLEPWGNAARRNSAIIETNVTKVGRYGRFSIETMVQDSGQYSPEYKAWANLQEIKDMRETERLRKLVEQNIYKFSLEQLRTITQLLTTPPPQAVGGE